MKDEVTTDEVKTNDSTGMSELPERDAFRLPPSAFILSL